MPTTNNLLVSVQLAVGGPVIPGSTFLVSVVPGANTFFFDPNFNSIPFSSQSGTVLLNPGACHRA